MSGKTLILATALFAGTAVSVLQFVASCEPIHASHDTTTQRVIVGQRPALFPLYEVSMEVSDKKRDDKPRTPLGVRSHGERAKSTSKPRASKTTSPASQPAAKPSIEASIEASIEVYDPGF